MNSTISAVIAARNEADRLPRCLRALHFCDEIVVVDDASLDASASIAKEFGARVVVRASDGNFHANKNIGIDQAKCRWILSIDADEIVPDDLAREIIESVRQRTKDAFYLKRKNFFGRRWIRGCGWYPDPVIRLFRKGTTCWPEEIHDTPKFEDCKRIATLEHDLLHYSYDSLSHYLVKFNQYTTRLAEEEREKGVVVRTRNLPLYCAVKPSYWFLRKYILQRGFGDGLPGLFIAASSAATIAMTYAKLLEMQESEK